MLLLSGINSIFIIVTILILSCTLQCKLRLLSYIKIIFAKTIGTSLAKFLKLEELDHDQHLLTETTGVSVDGTGQVGTYFYTAPEIEQRWPQINEKVWYHILDVSCSAILCTISC